MSNNSKNNSNKSPDKKILIYAKDLLISDRLFYSIIVLYVLIIIVVLFRELIVFNFRASEQFFLLLFCLFIPTVLIVAFIYITRNFTRVDIKYGDMKLEFTRTIKNEVTTELVENITATTESTLYSLASFMIVQPKKVQPETDEAKTVFNYIQQARGDSNQIIVGCQDYTEQRILCAIITELLNKNKSKLKRNENETETETEVEVIPQYNLGGVALNFIALSRGDIDIYPAYTWQGYEMYYGTYLSQKRESLIDESIDITKPNSTSEETNRIIGEANNRIKDLNELYKDLLTPLKWICYTGFYDNWNIVVAEQYAEDKKIEKISQLKHYQPLRLACEYDFFARPNGYRLLTSTDGYGLKFEKTSLTPHDKAYKALRNNDVDIIDGFTTDPEINDSIYRILEDDKKQFGRYYSSILVRKEFLKQKPQLESILKLLEGQITYEKMTDMIKKIDKSNTDEYYKTIEDKAKKFVENLPNQGKLEVEGETTESN